MSDYGLGEIDDGRFVSEVKSKANKSKDSKDRLRGQADANEAVIIFRRLLTVCGVILQGLPLRHHNAEPSGPGTSALGG